eukprot:CAMPEP_0168517784 /NCGR_PEP_ID=MMETSP0405-20121227/6283_1 /TAXON_ID=498012 /ORGANISM="Trichosphaerium sp, Strain Am-I-7 wt" /LENGTH=523 /DNA_ID=CAMNT_0008537911 /DNA_START=60 /DNA_END=1632 /DNA_ORIENTATION=+
MAQAYPTNPAYQGGSQAYQAPQKQQMPTYYGQPAQRAPQPGWVPQAPQFVAQGPPAPQGALPTPYAQYYPYNAFGGYMYGQNFNQRQRVPPYRGRGRGSRGRGGFAGNRRRGAGRQSTAPQPIQKGDVAKSPSRAHFVSSIKLWDDTVITSPKDKVYTQRKHAEQYAADQAINYVKTSGPPPRKKARRKQEQSNARVRSLQNSPAPVAQPPVNMPAVPINHARLQMILMTDIAISPLDTTAINKIQTELVPPVEESKELAVFVDQVLSAIRELKDEEHIKDIQLVGAHAWGTRLKGDCTAEVVVVDVAPPCVSRVKTYVTSLKEKFLDGMTNNGSIITFKKTVKDLSYTVIVDWTFQEVFGFKPEGDAADTTSESYVDVVAMKEAIIKIRQTLWWKETMGFNDSYTYSRNIIRVFTHLCATAEDWRILDTWKTVVIVYRALHHFQFSSAHGRAGFVALLRGVFEYFAAGHILPGGMTLPDPVRENKQLLEGLSLDKLSQVTKVAQAHIIGLATKPEPTLKGLF